MVTLTSTAVVTTIFGVGGASLAAYKMQRRTQGLTEFQFKKETWNKVDASGKGSKGGHVLDSELSTTICISGWLRDKFDYQRPWGLQPQQPKITDRLELLERFYFVFRPDYLPNCTKILSRWKGEETRLWKVLEEKYGRDPDHLLPLTDGPRLRGSLTLEQEETLDNMFVELGYNSVAPTKARNESTSQRASNDRVRDTWTKNHGHVGSTEIYSAFSTSCTSRSPASTDIFDSSGRLDQDDFVEQCDFQPPNPNSIRSL